MLDLRWVVDHLDEARAALARRGPEAVAALDQSLALDAVRRRTETEWLEQKQILNHVSGTLASIDKSSAEFASARAEMKKVGDQIKLTFQPAFESARAEVDAVLPGVPNLPDASVPDGRSAAENVVEKTWGERPRFDFAPLEHVAIGEALGIFDFERAAKISGARFSVLRGLGARLPRALLSFMLDVHSNEHGYTEMWTPVLIKDSAMRGTGQLPKFAADAFRIAPFEEGEGARTLYLAPTAEVPVTNLHSDEILEGASLPIAYTAYTPCFRSEAGSYGKDTRGLIRQHQFDKVEVVRFVRPEDALAEHERLTRHAETILEKLGLHYRRVLLCAGDLGANSKKTYDLEVWLPGQDAYREISSCSWFGDYQARRAKIRFRREKGAKPELVHTLNGSGLAIGRTIVAILEQGQQKDGSVRIPAALVRYMGGVDHLVAAG